jgi:hypothetical protein
MGIDNVNFGGFVERRCFIGRSHARITMGADETALVRLWPEKRGEADPPDYSDNLLFQLGLATDTNRATEVPMAQAESITTAIRELMSRGQLLKSTNRVRAVHTEFIGALAANAPRPLARSPITGPNIIGGDLTGSALALSRRAVVAPQIGRAGQADASPKLQLRQSAPAARARPASGLCQ